jgi:hypothetical protein
MKYDLEITRILLQRIPEEIIREHILPYTYLPQRKTLLRDIRSFTEDWRTLINYYIRKKNYSYGRIFRDVLYFSRELSGQMLWNSCYTEPWFFPKKDVDYYVEYRRLMVVCAKRNCYVSYLMYIYKLMYAFICSTHSRRRNIWFLFGLLRPYKRREFIQKYVMK